MIPATFPILFITLVGKVSCYDHTTVGDLPSATKGDLINILQGTLKPPEECDPLQDTDIEFLLYTRTNTNSPIVLNISNPTQVDPNKKIVLVAHGWLSAPTYLGIPELKDAYLQRYDCNLIIVDWSKIAWQSYARSYCQLPGVAQIVVDFLCLLDQELNVLLGKVHIIGHSMGAQLAGLIGQHTPTTCGRKVGRITGLDPAGSLFQGYPISQRLDASDAEFVDVIHTNALMFGYWGNCGDVDFHVNCGIIQPGCPDFNITNIETALVVNVICSHMRSLYYMAESANSDSFKAKSCTSCPLPCISDTLNASYITMGEDCPPHAPKHSYWIPTKGSAPYAEGCTPYPLGCS